jgi:hypothetical protein
MKRWLFLSLFRSLFLKAKRYKSKKIAANVDLVVQALKKIESDIRDPALTQLVTPLKTSFVYQRWAGRV